MRFPIMFTSTHDEIVKELEDKINRLERALDVADNNDKRDPATGRYIKDVT